MTGYFLSKEKLDGAPAWWLSAARPEDLPAENWIELPAADGAGLPLAEMVPLHLVAVHLAQATGYEAGKFLYSGKVTLAE